MKAVFDTNVLISSTLWKGPPYQCVLAVQARLAALALSEPILTELQEKLIEKFSLTQQEASATVQRYRSCSEMVAIQGQSGWVAADKDDDKFIETAIVAKAGVIVSGDKHLLNLKAVESIEIISARTFLDRLATASEDA